jgi:hypothetical protein
VIITIIFLRRTRYGRGRHDPDSDEVLASITKSWRLAQRLFLFLLIAQFIAYFSYSNIARCRW